MLINLKSETYSKLQHLAKSEGKSVAAYVSSICDREVTQRVSTIYTIKNQVEKKNNDE